MSNVIEIKNLSKQYRLGTISTGMLTKDIASAWARFIGKEDPNSRVTIADDLHSKPMVHRKQFKFPCMFADQNELIPWIDFIKRIQN